MEKVNPKKALGQHFLRDNAVIERIVSIIQENYAGHQLIEIGPGTGALTSKLLPVFSNVLECIEIDERCVEYLPQHFPQLSGRIHAVDFLKADLNSILGENATVVGNFPYNISSQIVFRIIEHRSQVPIVVGMFQKEVAERIASPAGSKDYGILSILTQLYYDAIIQFHIPPTAFAPPPKVMSSVIVLQRKTQMPDAELDVALFTRIVKAAFNQRRKMLRNALSGIFPPEMLQNDFFMQRAERLTVDDFKQLTLQLTAFQKEKNA